MWSFCVFFGLRPQSVEQPGELSVIRDETVKLLKFLTNYLNHHNDAIMSAMASQITSVSIVYSILYARATILNPFYNMEYKIIKKIRQNTAWIEADILDKHLTPNRCNALAPVIVYVSNDVTIPFKAVTSQ